MINYYQMNHDFVIIIIIVIITIVIIIIEWKGCVQ
jgi:hypothetical protein